MSLGKISWDQRTTLTPISPSPGPTFNSLIKGIHIGDPKFDKLTQFELKEVVCGSAKCKLPPDPEPDWVDYEAISRGQKLFQEYQSIIVPCLSSLLVNGFVVGRFTDVLELSGYTSSPLETHRRFEMTLVHILRWMHNDLSDPTSAGRQSITYVRCLHTLARKRAMEAWATAKAKGDGEIGIPLSQYDMTLVLLAFGPLSLIGTEKILGHQLSKESKADFIQTWRIIAYHLGIHDEYNICTTYERALATQMEALEVSKYYSESIRQSSYLLLKCTLEGFGLYSGLGSCYWDSLTMLATDPRAVSLNKIMPFEGSHMKHASLSAQLVAKFTLFSLRFRFFRQLTNTKIKHWSPRGTKFVKRIAIVAKFYDFVYWLMDRLFFPLTPLWLYMGVITLFRYYFELQKGNKIKLSPLMMIVFYHFGLSLAF